MDARFRFVFLVALVCHCHSIAISVAAAEGFLTDLAAAEPAALPADDWASTDWASDDFQPRWTGRLGAVILQRAHPASTPYIVSNTGAPVVDPSNFLFPFQGGADVGVIRHGQFADLDFRYFGVNQWNASQDTIIAPPGAGLAIPNFGASPDPIAISPSYFSCLNSVEMNLRRNVSPRWTVLGGFRYVSLHDDLFARAVDQVNQGISNVTFRTSNHLCGLQTGLDGILWDNGGRFRIEGVVKAGLYGNAATSNFAIGNGTNRFFLFSDSRSRPAFVGDLNFTGVYQLNDLWSLRAGYQLLWLSGVAIASEQLSGINPLAQSFQTNTVNGAFFHGALIGVERNW